MDADHLKIRVLDHGRGIPEEELKRVFEKFFRGRRLERRKRQALAFRSARDSLKLTMAESSQRLGRTGEPR